LSILIFSQFVTQSVDIIPALKIYLCSVLTRQPYWHIASC